MIINRLKLENWKTFDDAEFTFTRGVNIVEGSNYSGKTSFIQALYFALFNETLYKQLTAKDLKKESVKNASIAFDFTVDGQEYRIRRNISGEKVIKTDSYVYRLENGKEVEELEGTSKKGMKLAKIEELLKINSRFTKNINFIQEGSIPRLLNNPKTKILEDISSILQLDYFTEINGYCELGIKSTEKRVKELERKYNKAIDDLDILDDKIKRIERENTDLKIKEEDLKKKISKVKEKLKKYTELGRLNSRKKELELRTTTIKDKKDYISRDLGSLESELKELEESVKEVEALKEKSILYQKNEKRLKEFRITRQNLNNKLSIAKQSDLLLKDKKTQLESFRGELKELNEAQKKLDKMTPKLKSLETQLLEYNSIVKQLDEFKNKIEQETGIVENFKKGTCPITNSDCPVSGSFIEEYSGSIEQLKREKQTIEEKLQQMENPEQAYHDLLNEKVQFKDTRENSAKVKEEIEIIRKEVDKITQSEDEKKRIENELLEIEKKIVLVGKTTNTLLKHHEDYLSKKERVKGKEKLLSKIEDKSTEIKNIVGQISENENKIKEKQKEIEQFKSSHDIGDTMDLDKGNKQHDDWKKELSDIKLKIENNIFRKTQFGKKKTSLIEPYKSIGELRTEIEILVHRQYKIVFFQEALNLTLDELKSRKLKSIQDICNKMWHKFRLHSGRHLIDWDDNFLPILNIGGIERNLYQLSSSEKLFIYFSIRAALLAELGPNYFIVIDNLLNPFMIDNQKIVIDQIKQIVDETNIEQIIFTGFDISPDVKSDNHIKI
ncbi:MAG: AAA family ATPase [Promethearchaeota archaeon]